MKKPVIAALCCLLALGTAKQVDCPAERIEAIWLYFALNGRGITR